MNPQDNYPADLGMVPTGTKCGNNMVRELPLLLLPVSINETSISVNHINVLMCLSGMLQSTVSRHQKPKSVRNKRLLRQMQQPWGKKCVCLTTLWSAAEQ